MIRQARYEDFMAWRRLAEKAHSLSPFVVVPIDVEIGAKVFRQCMSSRLGCVFMSEHGGRITGTITGVAQEWWWCRKRVASDLVWYAERPGDGIALLRRFIQWAWSVPGVVQVMCSQSSGIEIERTGRVYERVGMRLIGGMYLIDRPAVAGEQAA